MLPSTDTVILDKNTRGKFKVISVVPLKGDDPGTYQKQFIGREIEVINEHGTCRVRPKLRNGKYIGQLLFGAMLEPITKK